MPSTNTEESLERWEQVREAAKSCGGAFKSGTIRKFPKYGEYTFEADWNPEFVNNDIFRTLSSNDVLCLMEGGPWFFGGKITSRSNSRVSGVVYTD